MEFEFKVRGGERFNELIVAEAFITSGTRNGEPIPLQCKWFTTTEAGKLKEIQGVKGAFYLPTPNDIGKKLLLLLFDIYYY